MMVCTEMRKLHPRQMKARHYLVNLFQCFVCANYFGLIKGGKPCKHNGHVNLLSEYIGSRSMSNSSVRLHFFTELILD